MTGTEHFWNWFTKLDSVTFDDEIGNNNPRKTIHSKFQTNIFVPSLHHWPGHLSQKTTYASHTSGKVERSDSCKKTYKFSVVDNVGTHFVRGFDLRFDWKIHVGCWHDKNDNFFRNPNTVNLQSQTTTFRIFPGTVALGVWTPGWAPHGPIAACWTTAPPGDRRQE